MRGGGEEGAGGGGGGLGLMGLMDVAIERAQMTYVGI